LMANSIKAIIQRLIPRGSALNTMATPNLK